MIKQTVAAILVDSNIANSVNKATISIWFKKKPIYSFFLLHKPERVVLDIYQKNLTKRLPLEFSKKNIIKRIRTSKPVNKQSSRLVLELTCKSNVKASIRQIKKNYNIILVVTSQQPTARVSVLKIQSNKSFLRIQSPLKLVKNPNIKSKKIIKNFTAVIKPTSILTTTDYSQLLVNIKPIVVAVDAGHGGQDPGATGPNGLHEKNVTIAIARKLKILLEADTMFKPVLTRNDNYFISLLNRSDVARKNGASVLISIHANAALNRSARGASVWILSNKRAKSEMVNWLEQREKKPKSSGSVGDFLANKKIDPYLSQVLLDLQFGYSQRVGYDIAVKVLSQLQRVSALHKRRPEYASLSVLRLPDIPSLLVEIGFISNIKEEQLLSSNKYQNKIANAIYMGLRTYFLTDPLKTTSQKLKKKSQDVNPVLNISTNHTKIAKYSNTSMLVPSVSYHIVKANETLSSISRQYDISISSIRTLNAIKKNGILIGQKLSLPVSRSLQTVLPLKIISNKPVTLSSIPYQHKIVRGDTLIAIALHYRVPIIEIKRINGMTSNKLILGQVLSIPSV
ncbi:N-acetylmuramoyl-L-alanine amidase [Candidatus Gullanella endobia]|nr:N-acetylmuramoyl-L-alanine amidase [Candidatus Gullanella endobia]